MTSYKVNYPNLFQPALAVLFTFLLAQVAVVQLCTEHIQHFQAALILLTSSGEKVRGEQLNSHVRARIHSQKHGMQKKTSLNSTCHFFSSRNSMDCYP